MNNIIGFKLCEKVLLVKLCNDMVVNNIVAAQYIYSSGKSYIGHPKYY